MIKRNNMQLDVRKAGPADARHIAMIGRQSFTQTFLPHFNLEKDCHDYVSKTYSDERVTQSVAKKTNLYFIGTVNGSPAGFVKLKPGSGHSSITAENVTELQRIYVAGEYIGSGIGQLLLDKAMEACSGEEPITLWLAVYKNNLRAIRFYEKNNFMKAGNHKFTIGTQEFDFNIMATRLNAGMELITSDALYDFAE